MKKFGLLLVVLTSLLLFGCSKKTAITSDEFKTKIQEDYTFVDVTEQFKKFDYISGAYLAVSHDTNYQIEFYTFKDNKGAEDFYKLSKDVFKASTDKSGLSTNVDSKNYSKYTLTTENRYKSITMIDSTVMYSDSDKTYKNTVEKLIKKLGY